MKRAPKSGPARVAALLAAVALLGGAASLGGCTPVPPVSDGADSGTPAYVQHVAFDQLDTWRGVHYDGLVLDVRTAAEWDGDLGHVDGSVPLPVDEIEAHLADLDRYRTKAVLVYDRLGTTSTRAGQILVTHGFRDVSALDGGIKAYRDWQRAK